MIFRSGDILTYKRLDTPISSALAAEVTAILPRCQQRFTGGRLSTYKTTNSTAIAPPFPMRTAAAAGAASPALAWFGERGDG
jgi:hypothetical protein